MTVYKKFNSSDIIRYNVNTLPRSEFASGSSGWRGTTGESGSVSLYGGIRSRETAGSGLTIQPIYLLDTYTADGKVELSASYPFTGSLSYVQVVNRELNISSEEHSSFWGDRFFRPIENLFEYYSRYNSDYTLLSNDYYMLYSEQGSLNKIVFSGSYHSLTGSVTVEANIKPLSIINTDSVDYTIISHPAWSFYIDGTTGNLAFSASDGSGLILTSSVPVVKDRWQHVSYNFGESQSQFLIDMVDVGSYITTGSIDSVPDAAVNLLFDEKNQPNSFHGFTFDLKIWNSNRTFQQISSSFDRTLTDTSDQNLLLYARLNDGTFKTTSAFLSGSGSFDSSGNTSGKLVNFNTRQAPIWHPNDNPNFITSRTQYTSRPEEIKVLHVPSLYYGRQIATGSVKLTCNSYLSSSLQRVLVDDGRGGLYLSGSATSSSLDTRDDYMGVRWNKVGSVFYSEGIIVITDPSLLDFGVINSLSPWQDDILQVSFKGTQTIPATSIMCRINGAEMNCSHNKTFSTRSTETGKLEILDNKLTTWITAVGIYDKERRLVAVAKLASPIRNRTADKLNIKLSLDF